MLASVPSAYTYGYNNKYPLTHVIRMELLDAGTPMTLYISSKATGSVALTYSGSAIVAQTKYLGARIVNLAGEEEIEGLGEVEYQVDISGGGGISSTAETNIILLNQGRFSEEYTYDIENQNIEIWEGYMPPSGSLSVTSDMILRFKGIMRNVGAYDYERFEIPCVGLTQKYTHPIPYRRINKIDYPNAPEESVGQAIPIVFGDFYYQQGEAVQNGYNDVLPAFCVDKTNLDYALAEHDLLDNVWSIIYKTSNGMAGTISNSNVTRSFDGNVFTLGLTNATDRRYNVFADFYIKPVTMGFHTSTDVKQANVSSSMDDSTSTYFLLTGSAEPSILSFAFDGDRQPPGVPISNSSSLGLEYQVQVHIDNTDVFGYPDPVQAYIYCRDTQNINKELYLGDITTSAASFNYNHTFFSDYTWDNLYQDEISVYAKGSSSATIKIRDVYMKVRSSLLSVAREWIVPAQIKTFMTTLHKMGLMSSPKDKLPPEEIENPTNIYAITRGVATPSSMWRGGYGNGDLIDNPAYAVEYILREKLNVPSTLIDTASFDIVGNTTDGTRKGWLIDSCLATRRDAFDYIAQICFEFSMFLIQSNEGKYKLIDLEEYATENYTITGGSIASDNGIPMFALLTTPSDNISNGFTAKYRYDYATRDYVETLYVSDYNMNGEIVTNFSSDTGSLDGGTYSGYISSSLARYGVRSDAEYEFDFIRNHATAENALKRIIDGTATKHLVVRTTLIKDTDTVRLQVGDRVLIDTDLMPSTHKNIVQFMITRINYPGVGKASLPYINVECEELPNSSYGLPVLISRFISSEDLEMA